MRNLGCSCRIRVRSAAAGLEYGGERFRKNFPDFIEKYNLRDMYSATFYPFRTEEERWAYLSRHILLNRFDNGYAVQLYKELLLQSVLGKEYFVITTNVDALFEKAGFAFERISPFRGTTVSCNAAVAVTRHSTPTRRFCAKWFSGRRIAASLRNLSLVVQSAAGKWKCTLGRMNILSRIPLGAKALSVIALLWKGQCKNALFFWKSVSDSTHRP